MNVKRFLDTNILIYAFATDDPRNEVAEDLVAEGGIVSIQVLNEFAKISHHKLGREWEEIRDELSVMKKLLDPPMPLTAEIHETAIDIAERYGFHFYDSLIVAAALRAKCSILYTEDLRHGQKIDGLTIKNPFTSEIYRTSSPAPAH